MAMIYAVRKTEYMQEDNCRLRHYVEYDDASEACANMRKLMLLTKAPNDEVYKTEIELVVLNSDAMLETRIQVHTFYNYT